MGADAARAAPVFAPVTLEGKSVRLEPLTSAHFEALSAAAADPAIWTWYPWDFSTPDRVRRLIDDALRAQAAGTELPFVQVERATGAVVGSTRYLNIECKHRRAEIGFTWLMPRCQRTPINTEAKFLLLRHAFETLGLMRVEFKTDSLNEKSRRAIGRIGGIEEGTLRNHMVTHTGRIRHTVLFSITDAEWPAVKARLEAKLLCHPERREGSQIPRFARNDTTRNNTKGSA
jgi:RimJ/RimL family protein N-acetyltransferase